MTLSTLLYLQSEDAAALRIGRFDHVTTRGDLTLVQCDFVSADGPYLHVNVSYTPGKSRTATVLLMIPHSLVRLIVQVGKQKSIAGFAQAVGSAG